MAAMKEIICACGCGRKKDVRLSDIRRGWGKFFSKSCKARHQEKRTGQYAKYKSNRTVDDSVNTYLGFTDREWEEIKSESEVGWDAHKEV